MGGVAKFVSRAPGNVVKGVSHAFSNPKDAVLNVATAGQYGLYNENKKAYTSGATSAVAGLITSGGNPLAAVLAGGFGAIKGGTDKQSQLGSAGQSALYGATLGALFGIGGTLSQPSQFVGPLRPGQTPPGASLSDKISTLFGNVGKNLSGAGDKALNLAGKSISGASKSLTMAGIVGGLKNLFGGKPSPGDQAAYGNAQDTAAGAGLNPQIVPLPQDSGGIVNVFQNPTAPGNLAKILLWVLLPGGLILAVWYWWKHRHKK